jgi:hypothetical protein
MHSRGFSHQLAANVWQPQPEGSVLFSDTCSTEAIFLISLWPAPQLALPILWASQPSLMHLESRTHFRHSRSPGYSGRLSFLYFAHEAQRLFVTLMRTYSTPFSTVMFISWAPVRFQMPKRLIIKTLPVGSPG